MKKNTFIVSLIILIIIVLVVYFVTRPGPVNQTQNPPETATTTSEVASTSPTTTVTPDPVNANLKVYGNSTLGISFSYPRDFFLINEGFSSTTGAWSALFRNSTRGEIQIYIAKTLPTGDTKLQSKSITINAKEATIYNTRRELCDARVAQTELDSDYKLQLSFISCGDAADGIYKKTDETDALLSSFTFTNENSRLFINTKLGEAFRYPTVWSRPVVTTTSRNTTLNFGNDLTIVSGAQYSTGLKRNLTIDEVVTGALTASSTTDQQITVANKPAHLLTTTPTTGSVQRVYYITHASPTDMVIIRQKGVDAEGLDLVVSSFTFFK